MLGGMEIATLRRAVGHHSVGSTIETTSRKEDGHWSTTATTSRTENGHSRMTHCTTSMVWPNSDEEQRKRAI